MLTHFSLFTGIGGIDLAAEWAGFKTVGQCEWADYPIKVLEKHWPDVPRWRDIRDVTAKSLYDRGVRTVKLVTGGDPCQPHSLIGDRLGMEDERYLWPEMLRFIEEITPDWVVNENVIGSVSNGVLDQKIYDLEDKGYSCQAFIIPACSIGAKHKRERVFLVANISKERSPWRSIAGTNTKDVGDFIQGMRPGILAQTISSEGKWKYKPLLGRGVHGIPSRVDRIECLGNAVVPQQVYPILKAIAEIERMA